MTFGLTWSYISWLPPSISFTITTAITRLLLLVLGSNLLPSEGGCQHGIPSTIQQWERCPAALFQRLSVVLCNRARLSRDVSDRTFVYCGRAWGEGGPSGN